MHRLKLTTTKGIIFIGPFVYTEDQAKLRMKKMRWLVKKIRDELTEELIASGKLEMFKVDKWPFRSEYNFDRVDINWIKLLERRWEDVDKKNFDEMEEGGA